MMIDTNMKEQLKSVFEKLENPVELVHTTSQHEKQAELVNMLNDVAGTSDKITVTSSDSQTDQPHFYIKYNGQEWR